MKVINLKRTCGGCPTIFEWENGKKENVYFRLRHGFARIKNETKNKLIASGSMGREFDGVCNFEDVVKWAKSIGIKLKQK